MKRMYPLFLFLSFTSITLGQNATAAEDELIKKVIVKSFDEIWSDLNPKSIDKFYTKDFLLLENGEVWNNDSIAKYISQAILEKKPRKRVNKFEFISVKILNGMAWVAYHNYATFTVDDKPWGRAHWLESATAILTENGWKLQMLHSTRLRN